MDGSQKILLYAIRRRRRRGVGSGQVPDRSARESESPRNGGPNGEMPELEPTSPPRLHRAASTYAASRREEDSWGPCPRCMCERHSPPKCRVCDEDTGWTMSSVYFF